MKNLGGSHPDTVAAQTNLELVRQRVRAQLGHLAGKPRAQRMHDSMTQLKMPCSVLYV